MRTTISLAVLLLPAAAAESAPRPEPAAAVTEAATSAPTPWELEPSSRWERGFSDSPRGGLAAPVSEGLEREPIGAKTRVHDLFDRWTLDASVRAERGAQYAEVTRECRGKVELDFALTPERWAEPEERARYYRAIDALIDRVGARLLADLGDKLEGGERRLFLRALKTLAWQESRWQHYLRYKDWFFVVVSGGSYNKLDDWGITQIARSSFDPEKLLNAGFFKGQGHCSLSSSLYYGFMEYYFSYLEARANACNGSSLFNKLIGAYNRYSSGYSACHDELAADHDYRDYQTRALGGFKDNFALTPWEEEMLDLAYDRGGVVRGPRGRKTIALVFTGGSFAGGGPTILDELKKRGAQASFFFTGEFLRNSQFQSIIERIRDEGHYLGAHSDAHLRYASDDEPPKLLVTRPQFDSDLDANLAELERFGVRRENARFFIPPYEQYTSEIARWTRERGMTLFNFTPGTRSNADYMDDDDPHFVPADEMVRSILRRESADPDGLSGFLLLMHIGTSPQSRTKTNLYERLGSLLDELSRRGYRFARVDSLLKY